MAEPEQIVAEAKRLIDAKRSQQAVDLLTANDAPTASNAEAAYLLGVARFRTKAFPEAETAFRQAVALSPGNHLAVYYLGLSLERQGQRDAAIDAFTTSVKLEPGFADGQRKLADLGVVTDAPPPAPTSPPTRRGPMTEFMIPEGPEQLDAYIDAKTARRRAEYSMEWKATPLPIKIIQLVILFAVLAFLVGVFVFLGSQILGS